MADQTPATTTQNQPKPVDQIRKDLQKMEPQFLAALPKHIPAERFARVAMTAIQQNPKLLNCTRASLFNALMKCAQDGLLPDGREAAIVPFGDEEDGRKAGDKASYMPMILGIRKKARNSGELNDWYAHVVHEGDEFDYQLGDDPHIHHKPSLVGGRRRKVIAAYSVAVLKDGSKSYEVMTIDEIEDVRKNYSRAKKGPWSDPVAYPEMCRKTVARLHSKQLPMSTDLDDLIRRDDELYDFKSRRGERGAETPAIERPTSARGMLDHFAGTSSNGDQQAGGEVEDMGQGEVSESDFIGNGQGTDNAGAKDNGGAQQQAGAEQAGAPSQKTPKATPPKNSQEYFEQAEATINAAGDRAAGEKWFHEEPQRKLRKTIGIPVGDVMEFTQRMFPKQQQESAKS